MTWRLSVSLRASTVRHLLQLSLVTSFLSFGPWLCLFSYVEWFILCASNGWFFFNCLSRLKCYSFPRDLPWPCSQRIFSPHWLFLMYCIATYFCCVALLRIGIYDLFTIFLMSCGITHLRQELQHSQTSTYKVLNKIILNYFYIPGMWVYERRMAKNMRIERQERGHSRFYSIYQGKDLFLSFFLFLEGLEVEGLWIDR